MRFLSIAREAYFPNLDRNHYRVTSDESPSYNCIAHAAGQDDKWWWPDDPPAHWPDGVEKVHALEVFVKAYETIGFFRSDTQVRTAEVGVDKVAIYVDADGLPTHAAKQLPDGSWSSKLGEWEDIKHDALEAVEDANDQGLGYGKVGVILRRNTPLP